MVSPEAIVSLLVLVFAGGILSFASLKRRDGSLDNTMYRIVLFLGALTMAFAMSRLAGSL